MKYESQLMDLTVVSNTYPNPPEQEIYRDHIIDSIESLFQDGANVVIVQGKEGIGKTNVLAQFAKQYHFNAISVFVKPSSSYTYDPSIIRIEICNQIHFILDKKEPKIDEVDGTFLRHRIYELLRHSKRKREPYYFILDGIAEIPDGIMHTILDILPFGYLNVRLLFSDENEKLQNALKQKKIGYKDYNIPGFAREEELEYLSDLNFNSLVLQEIRKVCKGRPSHLSSIRRILRSGLSIDNLLNDLPERLPDLFEIEWRKVNENDEQLLTLLGILAFDHKVNTLSQLSEILMISSDEIEKMIFLLEFVNVDPNFNEVSFITESFRKFVMQRLTDIKNKVQQLLIEHFMKDPTSEDSLKHLPTYLEQAGEWIGLLEYLSPENFSTIIKLSKSLINVKQYVQLGLNAAENLYKDPELLRFGMHMSVLDDNSHTKVWRSEVEARMAINDYENAVALAQSTIIQEDRLHLLAVIARKKKEQGLNPEPELIEQIRTLYKGIDHDLGNRGIEIACDLIYSCHDLAIGLVERIAQASGKENALDWAFARLSIASLGAKDKQDDLNSTIEDMKSRINDPLAKRFSVAASLIIEEYSAQEVINEAEKLDSATDQLFLLRLWANSIKKRDDAVDVLEYALKLAIRTTDYAPNDSLYKELAVQLPYVNDHVRAEELVGILDSQMDTIKHLGPTEDFVSLQMLLAETEMNYNQQNAFNRVVNAYLSFCEEEDLSVRTTSLAIYMTSLAKMDLEKEFEKKEGLHSLTHQELEMNVEQLLAATAEHNQVTNSIVENFAKTLPQIAYDIAIQLNTETRRNLALFRIVDHGIEVPLKKIDSDYFVKVLSSITEPYLKDVAIIKIIERLSASFDELDDAKIDSFKPFFTQISEVGDAEERCKACCLSYNVLSKPNHEKFKELKHHTLGILSESWECINVGWSKVNVGFKIVELLSPYDIEKAREYMERTEKFRDTIILDNPRTANAFLASLRLLLRAFSGLIPKKVHTEQDLERIRRLIQMIPSTGEQAILWADIALRFQKEHDLSESKRIVSEYVRPLLENISKFDQDYRNTTITIVSPALYFSHRLSALETISTLPETMRDAAYKHICSYIVNKQPLYEPIDTTHKSPSLDYDDCLDILDLLNLIERDSTIHEFIESVVESIVGQKNHRLSSQQINHIADRIENLIQSKFPNTKYIRHNGYKIASEAQLYRLRKVRNWEELIRSARLIENTADRAYVLTLIAIALPQKETAKRAEIVMEAREIIDSIPVLIERIDHYETLAQQIMRYDPGTSRKCIEVAMQDALKRETDESQSSQRRLIDLAHRLDPTLASSLVSLLDDDPARREVRDNLEKRVKVLELKKDLVNSTLDQANDKNSVTLYPDAAWMRLAALNANRVETVHIEHTREIVRIAANISFRDSYPIYAWLIENAVKRFSGTNEASTILRPIFEATLLAAEFSLNMATRANMHLKRTKSYVSRTIEGQSILIKPGEREQAIQYLRDWFSNEKLDYVKICDPYFGPSDLEILRLLSSIHPECFIQILTSKKHHEKEKVPVPYDETYLSHWRVNISDQDPPDTQILIVGTKSQGVLPIHDRWILTNGRGLRLGTSFNSLGVTRESEISIMTKEEAFIREVEVDKYLTQSEREIQHERLMYQSFNM